MSKAQILYFAPSARLERATFANCLLLYGLIITTLCPVELRGKYPLIVKAVVILLVAHILGYYRRP